MGTRLLLHHRFSLQNEESISASFPHLLNKNKKKRKHSNKQTTSKQVSQESLFALRQVPQEPLLSVKQVPQEALQALVKRIEQLEGLFLEKEKGATLLTVNQELKNENACIKKELEDLKKEKNLEMAFFKEAIKKLTSDIVDLRKEELLFKEKQVEFEKKIQAFCLQSSDIGNTNTSYKSVPSSVQNIVSNSGCPTGIFEQKQAGIAIIGNPGPSHNFPNFSQQMQQQQVLQSPMINKPILFHKSTPYPPSLYSIKDQISSKSTIFRPCNSTPTTCLFSGKTDKSRANLIRLIDSTGKNLGLMTQEEATNIAKEEGKMLKAITTPNNNNNKIVCLS